jgi:hypothetical protein
MGRAPSATASFVLYKNQSSFAQFTTLDLVVNFCCLVAEKMWEMNRFGILAAVWLFFIFFFLKSPKYYSNGVEEITETLEIEKKQREAGRWGKSNAEPHKEMDQTKRGMKRVMGRTLLRFD